MNTNRWKNSARNRMLGFGGVTDPGAATREKRARRRDELAARYKGEPDERMAFGDDERNTVRQSRPVDDE